MPSAEQIESDSVIASRSGTAVCEAFIAAMTRWGVPFEVLTDNGKQFTGKFTRPLPVEVLFERTCREYGITARLTKRRSPTTTGKIERFHRTLRRELLDETGAFSSLADAQAAIDQWVHAYNTARPHQSLEMATPASLFRPRTFAEPTTGEVVRPATVATAACSPAASAQCPSTVLARATDAIEFDVRVPPSGVVGIAGIQQLWIGKNHAGKIATLWMDLTSVHVIVDEAVVKTVLSRLTTTDLERLQMRGARPGRSTPAVAAVDITTADERLGAIEIDRTADRNGIVIVRGHQLKLGVDTAGTRVTLRIDGDLIYAAAGNHLIKTMPNPLGINEIRRLTGVRKATTPLPPPPPAGPQTVQRRIPKNGRVMVAGQRIRVGAIHAGIIVNIVVEDHHFRVLDGTKELSLHARTTSKPLRVFNAHRPQHRKLSPEDRRTRMS